MKLIGINNCCNVCVSFNDHYNQERYDKRLQDMKSEYKNIVKVQDNGDYEIIVGDEELINDFMSTHDFSVDKIQFF